MRFKLWPDPPADLLADDADLDIDERRERALEAVLAARDALPLVPGSEDDCCARLMDRRGVERRDVARTWITFLRALELAEATDDGYRRRRGDVDGAALARATRENLFGVETTLSVLADANRPLDADAVFDRLREEIPQWERHKRPREWEDRWAEKVATLLQWCVLFGLLEKRNAGYVVADDVSAETLPDDGSGENS